MSWEPGHDPKSGWEFRLTICIALVNLYCTFNLTLSTTKEMPSWSTVRISKVHRSRQGFQVQALIARLSSRFLNTKLLVFVRLCLTFSSWLRLRLCGLTSYSTDCSGVSRSSLARFCSRRLWKWSGLFLQSEDFCHDVHGVAVFRSLVFCITVKSCWGFSPLLLKTELSLALLRFVWFSPSFHS